MSAREVILATAARTAIGTYYGTLKSTPAADLSTSQATWPTGSNTAAPPHL